MGRRKLSMKLIRNQALRRATFHKRKMSLFKKASELATLCDISVCAIVYGPEIDDGSEAETWPQNHDEVRRVIDLYKSKMSYKRGLDLRDFYNNRTEQIKKQIARTRSQNDVARFPSDVSLAQLKEVLETLDKKIGVVDTRIDFLKKGSLGLTEAAAEAPDQLIDCPIMKMDYSSREGIPTGNMQPIFVNPLDTFLPMKMDYSSQEGIPTGNMQPIFVNPLDTFLPMQYSSSHDLQAAHQMTTPFEQNSMVGQPMPLMMLLNGLDCSQIGNASSNNCMYPPGTAVMENQILNSSFGSSSSMMPYFIHGPGMQPILPYVQRPVVPPGVSSELQHLPQIYDASDYPA